MVAGCIVHMAGKSTQNGRLHEENNNERIGNHVQPRFQLKVLPCTYLMCNLARGRGGGFPAGGKEGGAPEGGGNLQVGGGGEQSFSDCSLP